MPALKSTSAVVWQRSLRCVWAAGAESTTVLALKSTSAVVWQRSLRCVWAGITLPGVGWWARGWAGITRTTRSGWKTLPGVGLVGARLDRAPGLLPELLPELLSSLSFCSIAMPLFQFPCSPYLLCTLALVLIISVFARPYSMFSGTSEPSPAPPWKAHRRSRGSARCGVSGRPRPAESTAVLALKSAPAVAWQRSLRCVWATEADRVHSGACAEKHIGGCVAALIAVCLGGRDRPSPQRCLR